MDSLFNYFDLSSDENFLNSSSSSEEETLELFLVANKNYRFARNAINNYFEEVVLKYNEKEFITHFRINRTLFNNIAAKYEESDIYTDIGKNKTILPAKQLALFLWFAGHEACCYRDLADRFNLSLSTVHVIITRLISFISSLSTSVIIWPNEEKQRISCEYFERKGFPGLIGAIDGTHIIIDPPSERKDSYIDRKGNISITMQAVCNEEKKFIDVFIGYPGSVHDARIFKNSSLYNNMPAYCGIGCYILGDSAYTCTEHVIVPFKDNGHLSQEQKYFNTKLSSARVIIEHSFGILKQRFRQLYYCKLKGMFRICHFVRACCVLHNLANEEDLDVLPPEDDIEYDDLANKESYLPDSSAGKALRLKLSQDIFLKRN